MKAIDKNVNIKTYEPIDGEKVFEGRLISYNEGILIIEVKIKTRTMTVEIPFDKVAKARLAIIF